MTFEKLHDGLDDHSCMGYSGIEDDTTNHYVRGLSHPLACIHQFESLHEMKRKPRRPLNDPEEKCQWRCVSVNLLGDRDEVRKHYIRLRGFSPQSPYRFPYLCVFRLVRPTAKVWNTAHNYNPTHRSLMKSDEFVFADLELLDVTPIDQF